MKPLEGLKVVELATFVAGPTCARALADWGAQVVKIESPKGDPMRGAGRNTRMATLPEENPNFDLCNMGKQALALNLRAPRGQEIMERLLQESDVFVTNNRTQALSKMGLDYERLKQRHPHLIFAQVLGYGEIGSLKDKPGFDFTAFYARGGISGTLYERGTSPLNPIPAFGDNPVALYLASGILAALYRRSKTGTGDKITVSLYHAALFAMGTAITAANYGFSYPISRREVVNPFLNTYRTKDDRWLQLAAPEYDRMYPVIMKALGREDMAEDERYCKFSELKEAAKEVLEILETEIIKQEADAWVDIFDAVDVPCEKAWLWREILKDQQAWDNGFLHKMEYRTGNSRTLVELPVRMESLGKVEHERAPLLGENSQEILRRLGYSDQELKEFEKAGVFA